MRLEKQPTFRRKANEKQYQFNLEVKDKLDEAATALVFTWISKGGCCTPLCCALIIDPLLPYSFELSSHGDAVELKMQSVTSKPELVSNSVPFVKGRLREHSEFRRSELQAS